MLLGLTKIHIKLCKLWGACKIQASIKLYILSNVARVFSLFCNAACKYIKTDKGLQFPHWTDPPLFQAFWLWCLYHPSVWPCPQAFLPYTEPWWIIDLKFKVLSRLTFWVYIHWWKPSKNLHLFGTKLHNLMQGHQENSGNHWNFFLNLSFKA